mgnify:CR=1 FL=1
MTITRVEKLIYGVEDMDTGATYYRDWGVDEVESGPERTVFRTRTGQTIELRPAGDPSLPGSPDPAKSTLRRAVWGVRDADGLKEMGEDLARDGMSLKRTPRCASPTRAATGWASWFRPRPRPMSRSSPTTSTTMRRG